MSMKSTPSSGRRRSVASAPARSAGGPQMPLPVMRIAPKPRRWIWSSPPMRKVLGCVVMCRPVRCDEEVPAQYGQAARRFQAWGLGAIPDPCQAVRLRVQRRQVLVDQRHRRGAFADRAAHALDRARAHVAHREHAGHARSRAPPAAAPDSRRARQPCRSARSRARRPRRRSLRASAVSGSAPTNRKTLRSRAVVLGAAAAVAPRHAAQAGSRLAVQAPPARCAAAARCWARPRCGRSGSATCWPPAPAPRTSMWTLAACCDRNTAAWPGRVAAAHQRHLAAARTSWPRAPRPSTRRRGLRTPPGAARAGRR